MKNIYLNKIFQIEPTTGKQETYAELLQKSVQTAIYMRNQGIKPGDIISVCTNNHLNSFVPFLAGSFIGVISANLDPKLSIDDTAHLVKQVQPKLIFVSKNAEKLIENSIRNISFTTKIISFEDEGLHFKFSEILKSVTKEEEDSFQPRKAESLDETAVIIFSSGTTGLAKGITFSQGAFSDLCKRR